MRSKKTLASDCHTSPLHVLVVDDSAVVRQAMAVLLPRDPAISVATASDPLIAQRKIKQRRPDVIVLDLEMPRMHGLTFLRKLMKTDPIPVVICSGVGGRGSDMAMQALADGAVDVVTKPQLGVASFLADATSNLIEIVRAASQARMTAAPRAAAASPPPQPRPDARPICRSRTRAMVVGASTGGPEALRYLLSGLPAHAPPVLVVQHMPAGFTAALARRLDATCAMNVREARHGEPLRSGTVLISPGDQHMMLVRTGPQPTIALNSDPPVSGHCPSVDVLFDSAAKAMGRNAIGVLLTGMGQDGASGLARMRQAGAWTLAQSEASCAVFGMPRRAIELGAADAIVDLAKLPGAIMREVEATRADR